MRPHRGCHPVLAALPPLLRGGGAGRVSSSEDSNQDPTRRMKHLLFPEQSVNLQSRTSWPPGSLPEAQWPQLLPLDLCSSESPSCLLSLPSPGRRLRAHSSPPGTLPRDVGGPSGLLDQSNLIYGQQVVSEASNGALPPTPRSSWEPGLVCRRKHNLGTLFPGLTTAHTAALHGGSHSFKFFSQSFPV